MKVYYSIINGGDGSAYPHWYESQELADWDNDHQSEGWGETCTGSIEFTGEALFDIKTKEGYLVNLFMKEDENFEEFKEDFFPNEIPEFTVNILNKNYYGIYFNDKLVHKQFQYPGETSDKKMQEVVKFLEQLK
jgi:hypothetical protein